MSDEDDYDDELPMISVNSSVNDSSTFSMPSADVIASQRARELECEREIQLLRERDAACKSDIMVRCDSSGSETEAVLAAAVNTMNVAPAPVQYAPRLVDLLPPVAAALPETARPLLLHPEVVLQLPQLVESISTLVCCDGESWSNEDVWSAGALLAAAAIAHDAGAKGRVLRALHTLVDQRASHEQVTSLGRMLLSALTDARARLELSDAVRSGGDAAADRLATHILDVAIVDLLDPPVQVDSAVDSERLCAAVVAGWRALSADAAYTLVQLLGRRLAAPGPGPGRGGRGRLLAALAPAPTPHKDMQRPERLKVLVSASKLRVLFRSES